MKKALVALASAALALGALAGTSVSAPPPSEAAYCAITWGSQPQATATASGEAWFSPHTVKGVRTGRHACYDRLVVDVRGPAIWHHVRYGPVRDGDGRTLSLRGAADLQVFLTNPSTTGAGTLTWRPGNTRELRDVSGYRTFRQVVLASHHRETVTGEYDGQPRSHDEAYTSIGLGVRARLPFRVFQLEGPDGGSRLVVDVAHRW
ncbi:hypothetical protein [Citricoccus sp.]|uniref:AMIN-like domain-containing (lipo)protein n=1 Tax=Citricoccus sp. TaxID=1978372 RepID=UPI002636EE12|nr:hypothetical protein [Citricoccus sp.]HRO31327.1 hypothetical protein [Citricoccus sp.]